MHDCTLRACPWQYPHALHRSSARGSENLSFANVQYMAAVSGGAKAGMMTEQRVLETNPLLEAFGNAKTLRHESAIDGPPGLLPNWRMLAISVPIVTTREVIIITRLLIIAIGVLIIAISVLIIAISVLIIAIR